MTWNFDISQAPRGKTIETMTQTAKGLRSMSRFIPERVILATKCGKVTLSHYIPDEDRWMMLGKGEQPDAWFAWPTHPNSPPTSSTAAKGPALDAPQMPGHQFEGII